MKEKNPNNLSKKVKQFISKPEYNDLFYQQNIK